MGRNVTLTTTGYQPIDARKALIKKIEELEKKYADNTASVSDLASAKLVVTGNTPFKVHIFIVTSTMSTGAYVATYTETADNVESVVDVVSIDVTPATSSLVVAGTQQLDVAYTPSNATGKNVTYTTSDATKAIVSASGLVTAVAAGNATITITTANGKTDTVAITVTP